MNLQLSKEWKTTLTIIGIVLFLGTLFLFGKPYKPEPRTPPKTAEQIEQEDLVKKIQSGSSLWASHAETIRALERDIAAELSDQKKVENYVAGYRKTLCAKYELSLSSSGSLEHSPECSAMNTVSFQ
jgi:hypothetical protein